MGRGGIRLDATDNSQSKWDLLALYGEEKNVDSSSINQSTYFNMLCLCMIKLIYVINWIYHYLLIPDTIFPLQDGVGAIT